MCTEVELVTESNSVDAFEYVLASSYKVLVDLELFHVLLWVIAGEVALVPVISCFPSPIGCTGCACPSVRMTVSISAMSGTGLASVTPGTVSTGVDLIVGSTSGGSSSPTSSSASVATST